MPHLVEQTGAEPKWFETTITCTRYITSLFGVVDDQRFMSVYNQIAGLKVGKQLRIPDLSFRITRY